MIAQERELWSVSPTTNVDPLRVRAADVAVAHARALVSLPPFSLVWCHHPQGYRGQTIVDLAGRITVLLRADLPERGHPLATARETIFTMLHELGHVRDAALLDQMDEEQAEARANDFASWAIRTFPWEAMR